MLITYSLTMDMDMNTVLSGQEALLMVIAKFKITGNTNSSVISLVGDFVGLKISIYCYILLDMKITQSRFYNFMLTMENRVQVRPDKPPK